MARIVWLSEDKTADAVRLYVSGATIKQVATTFHVASATMRRILVENGVQPRQPGRRGPDPVEVVETFCERCGLAFVGVASGLCRDCVDVEIGRGDDVALVGGHWAPDRYGIQRWVVAS